MDERTLRLHGPVLLASGKTDCWKCQSPTVVHAILASGVDEVDGDGAPVVIDESVFIYGVATQDLPSAVAEAIAIAAPTFKPILSQASREVAWCNACQHCGALQGGVFVHNEPESPFFGGPVAFKGTTTLLSEGGFDVGAASYSF